jgi:FkbM family methyltransferase
MKNLMKKAISNLGYELRKSNEIRPLPYLAILEFLRTASRESDLYRFMHYACENAKISNSQIFQDLFVLQALDEKRGGYFVEFGATDGKYLSNSFLLERDFGWKGIVAEPSVNWHAALKINRKCAVDTRCVWDKTGEQLHFSQTDDPEYSAVASLSDPGYHGRSVETRYNVETISINDLLKAHGAPNTMDYLSIDTEGSELKILQSFDFDKWSFGVITVEHAYVQERRDGILKLLTSHGYKRVIPEVSHWDDWYVLTD